MTISILLSWIIFPSIIIYFVGVFTLFSLLFDVYHVAAHCQLSKTCGWKENTGYQSWRNDINSSQPLLRRGPVHRLGLYKTSPLYVIYMRRGTRQQQKNAGLSTCRSLSIHCLFNSLWASDAIWRHRSESTLAQVMACCLTAPSHYLNQCWLIISKVQ